MSTKSILLNYLEKNKGTFISGQELAQMLNVSRTAVWKSVNELKKDGYNIEAVTNKGYALSENSDILSAEAITQNLSANVSTTDIKIYKSIDSTNNQAKRLIMEGSSYGTILLAEHQTSGKGRRGKSFASPQGHNIYVSFILKPMVDVRDSLLITVAASVAVSRALEQIGEVTNQNIKPMIKWVNDVYVDNKKVCGILTEAVSDIESGQIQSLILGIGVNINGDINQYPKEIRDVVGTVAIPPGKRNLFVAILIDQVEQIQKEILDFSSGSRGNQSEPAFIKYYKDKSLILGKEIYIIKENIKLKARAIDINNRGELSVEYKNGSKEILSSGEISIRLN